MSKSSLAHPFTCLTLLFTLFFVSCTPQKQFLGPVIREADIKNIRSAETTQKDITSWFGDPQRKIAEQAREKYIYDLFGDHLEVEFDENKKVYNYVFQPEALNIITNSGFISKKQKFTKLDLWFLKVGKTGSRTIKKNFGEPSIYESGTHRERYTFYRRQQKIVILMNKKQDFVLEYKVEDLRL